MAILIFFAVLFALVLVHEFGHFIVAKWSGMRVDEFGIGFPPKVVSTRKGETEYSLNLLPIGGFVRIFGEDAVDAEASPERDRAFVAKSKWQQALVLIAGVTMNVLFAWLLFILALSIGTQTTVSETEAGPDASLVIADVIAESPAMEAGIPRGAEVVGYGGGDGEAAVVDLTPSAFSEYVSTEGSDGLTLTYRVGDTTETVLLEPKTGLIPDEEGRPAIGVSLALIEVVSRPVHEAVIEATVLTGTMLRDITVGISGLLADAVTLDADLSNVAGPVGIVGLVGEASAFGVTTLLMFTAFISLNLAIINLLPFPALDGGRLVIVGIEALKGSPIRPSFVQAVNMLGFALLILLMIAVTYNDIARII